MKFGFLSILLFAVFLVTGCTYDNEKDLFGDSECGDLSSVSLKNDVVPILENACYSCHGVGVQTGGIELETYDNLSIIAESGQLLGALNHMEGFIAMPPSGEMLPECDIKTIKQWIEQGLPNN